MVLCVTIIILEVVRKCKRETHQAQTFQCCLRCLLPLCFVYGLVPLGLNHSRKTEAPLCCGAVCAQQETGGFFLSLVLCHSFQNGSIFFFLHTGRLQIDAHCGGRNACCSAASSWLDPGCCMWHWVEFGFWLFWSNTTTHLAWCEW